MIVQESDKIAVFRHDYSTSLFRRLEYLLSVAFLRPRSRRAIASTEKLAPIQIAIAGESCASIQMVMPPILDDPGSAPRIAKQLANHSFPDQASRLRSVQQ